MYDSTTGSSLSIQYRTVDAERNVRPSVKPIFFGHDIPFFGFVFFESSFASFVVSFMYFARSFEYVVRSMAYFSTVLILAWNICISLKRSSMLLGSGGGVLLIVMKNFVLRASLCVSTKNTELLRLTSEDIRVMVGFSEHLRCAPWQSTNHVLHTTGHVRQAFKNREYKIS